MMRHCGLVKMVMIFCFAFAVTGAGKASAEEVISQPGELNGTVVAAHAWEVSSPINGRIEEILFSEGQSVAEGDLLVRLDDRQARVTLALAESRLKLAEAVLVERDEDLARHEELIEREAVSVAAYGDAAFEREIAQLEKEAADLEVQIAKGVLDLHRITAKADGLISAPRLHEGSNFSVELSGPIAQVVQLNPVHVRVGISLEKVLTRLKEGNYTLDEARSLVYEIVLPDGSAFAERGSAEAVGYDLDPETGEGSILISFPNPEGLLRPGMPVSLRAIQP
ncbi:efflux RND transporter periplasmic adaptor subunit [Shimia sp. SDUM112013]|uniref:efflux RND transporter periplasmic adaptor subunit n=1 Tax=Shimia sp. SDUM112013 TaxID=3136160 RepID=UPI0032ECB35F